ncbi:MAG: hypothetical protein LBH47_00250, partial [Christensenellaceae bacterium]|nr:hypothetical protein [Christensenellaceae bacterium]
SGVGLSIWMLPALPTASMWFSAFRYLLANLEQVVQSSFVHLLLSMGFTADGTPNTSPDENPVGSAPRPKIRMPNVIEFGGDNTVVIHHLQIDNDVNNYFNALSNALNGFTDSLKTQEENAVMVTRKTMTEADEKRHGSLFDSGTQDWIKYAGNIRAINDQIKGPLQWILDLQNLATRVGEIDLSQYVTQNSRKDVWPTAFSEEWVKMQLDEKVENINYYFGLDVTSEDTFTTLKSKIQTLINTIMKNNVVPHFAGYGTYLRPRGKGDMDGEQAKHFLGTNYVQERLLTNTAFVGENYTNIGINGWCEVDEHNYAVALKPYVDVDAYPVNKETKKSKYITPTYYDATDKLRLDPDTVVWSEIPSATSTPSEQSLSLQSLRQMELEQAPWLSPYFDMIDKNFAKLEQMNANAVKVQTQSLDFQELKNDIIGTNKVLFYNMENGNSEVADPDWVSYKPHVALGDDMSIFNLQGVSMRDGVTKMALTDGVTDPQTIADMIDRAMMAARRDISLFDQFSTDANSNSNSGNIIGYASYLSLGAVSHLYALWEISYLVGYVGIVITIGVYLNFTFGLIQRILHLGVLYVMSPLTIAFYPFDNGERFTSSFVKPFYKQAISGYAIILSMNLFYVFLAVVRGKDLYGTGSEAGQGAPLLLGTLLTVSVMTMLPKIRDTVREILGADSISEKKLGEVFKDAGKIAASPFKAMAKPVGGLTHIGRQIHANRVLNKNKREDKGGYNDWKKSRGKDEKGGFLGLKGLRAMNKKKKELGIKNSVVKTLWGDSNSVLAKTKAFQGAYKLFDPREKDKEYLKYAQDEQSLVAADERAKNLAGVQNAYGAVWTYEQKENGLEDKLKNKVFTQEEIAAKGLTDEEIKTKADKNRNEWMKEYGMNDVGVTEKAKQELAREKEGAELKEKMNKEFEALQASLKLRFGVKIDRDDLKKIKDQLSIVYDLKNTPKQRADAQAKAMDILLKKSTNAGDTHEAFKRYQFISKTETNLAGAEFAKIIEQQLSRVDTSVAAALMTDTKFNMDSARDKAKFCEDMSEILHANYGGKTEEEEKEFKKNAVEKYINDNNYDNETVTKVMSLEKKLADFEQFGHIQAQIVGDKNGPISGAGTTAMQNAVAVVYELGMLKKAAEQLQGLITAAGQEQNAIMNRQESLARGAELIAKGLSESAVDFAKAANEKCNTIEEFRTELVKVTQEMATRNTANPELEEKFERLRACLIDNPADLNTKRIIDQLSQSIIDSKNMDLHGSREAVLTSQQSQIQGQIAQNLQHVEQNAVQ